MSRVWRDTQARQGVTHGQGTSSDTNGGVTLRHLCHLIIVRHKHHREKCVKFKFGGLYKFIVSLGVVIISISALVPRLFLKESFDLYKSEADLKSVTSVAHAAILDRQETVAFTVKFILWLPTIGCICGSIFFCWPKNGTSRSLCSLGG